MAGDKRKAAGGDELERVLTIRNLLMLNPRVQEWAHLSLRTVRFLVRRPTSPFTAQAGPPPLASSSERRGVGDPAPLLCKEGSGVVAVRSQPGRHTSGPLQV